MGEAKKEEAKADTKPEEKKEEKAEEKKEEKAEEKKEEAKPPSPIILFVDMHCVGCAKRVERCILKYKGVEGVEVNMARNEVTVKGILDPEALCMRIQKKTRRKASVLSPLPTTEGESTKPQLVTSQVSEVTSVELNVNMHCEACAQQLKNKILKMRGVQSAETELSSGKITVTGTMDANRLVEYVYRRTRKVAKIVPQPIEEKEEEKKEEGGKEGEKPPEEAPKEEEKKEENEEKKEEKQEEKKEETAEKKEEEKAPEQSANENNNDGEKKEEKGVEGSDETKKEEEEENEEMAKKMMYWPPPLYVIEQVPPPQLFSDENPNACCIS